MTAARGSQRPTGFTSLRRRLATLPPPIPEESIPLRVMVQVLVAIGIGATDLAAGTSTALWAVPASCVGAYWSWLRRRDRNVSTKFAISIGMLVATVTFFGRLLASLNDTRLVLAELLIHLQILHNFDLPRRKDLGYSMVIGLILLGVAGTLSETLVFAPALLTFLVAALPVLVLDYRSRLGLETRWFAGRKPESPAARMQSPLAPQQLGVLLLMVLGLGLGIFAVMPRFPGYQLQPLSVGAPSDVSDRGFDSEARVTTNPGYVNPGDLGSGLGANEYLNRASGAGPLNPTYYYGFADRINQNLRGRLEPRVVMRVRSQARGWARVLAFDRYTGQGWEISKTEELTSDLERPPWTYRFRLTLPRPTEAQTRRVVQTYAVTADLPNVIPAQSLPESVFFPTREIALDPNHGLRSPLPLPDGLTYTVISQVPIRDRTALRQASTDYPRHFNDRYMEVPPAIKARVRARAEELLAQSEQPLVAPYEQALYLAQALKQNYELLPDLPFLSEGDDVVDAFLFAYGGGYPDHFATTLTVMLRSLGIPARLATGFGPGQFNPFTGLYVVRNTDAYAITEVYFPGHGWLAFDAIPGHEIIPPSADEVQTFGVLRQFWHWVAGWLPPPLTAIVADVWSAIASGLAWAVSAVWRLMTRGWGGAFVGLTGALALGWLSWFVGQQVQAWRFRRYLSRLHPAERLYRRMLQLLAMRGYAKHPAQTPREYARGVSPQLEAALAEAIADICTAYSSWRYGGVVPNADFLHQQLRLLARGLDRGSS
ncbi:transglutaminase-like enzyme, putative cysteine protease [Rubidibacter lacunae KORDI 51-2]|uniref:Transglutaminase-like enzyme, putative cysteine protease n=1 Tax=Rubidibacter lacunae KORDI 51-2 TaxID=582515 RepID=U5DMX9_9CHRO|nr:transglutaminaseTgpA domain-containing protein [Rubidibacter lacunae]ERN41050.1 transglutaminase-like enzyme, putative cysteine protease [Rubidibacter lacunae KORDI 51-2]